MGRGSGLMGFSTPCSALLAFNTEAVCCENRWCAALSPSRCHASTTAYCPVRSVSTRVPTNSLLCFPWLAVPSAGLRYLSCNMTSRHISHHLQAILSNEIDWDAPELQPLSAAARDFLERLLQRNPVLRPSAAEALEHPWLAVEGAANDMPLKVRAAMRKRIARVFGCWLLSARAGTGCLAFFLLHAALLWPWCAMPCLGSVDPLVLLAGISFEAVFSPTVNLLLMLYARCCAATSSPHPCRAAWCSACSALPPTRT